MEDTMTNLDNSGKASSARGESRRVLTISAGANHSVALLSGGKVCSWGRGEDGQLGHGEANDHNLPTIVSALENCAVSAITCGADHTTARSDSTRTVYSWGCWGRNQNGQLGLGHNEDSLRPQKIPTFQGVEVKMVAAGAEHTAAITSNGRLFGWGWGRYGNLGLGDCKDRLVPAEVFTLNRENMKMVACGWRHTIVVSEAGNIYSYGWCKYGQLGHGTFQDLLIPHQVLALNDRRIESISGGWRHSMAVDDEGRLYGWGWNKFGQVGCGNTADQNIPQLVRGLSHERVVHVTCGWRHTLATTLRSNVYSWGRGTSGQLGHGDAVDRFTPKMVELLSADGYACRQIASSLSTSLPGGIVWETETDSSVSAGVLDASVPDTD